MGAGDLEIIHKLTDTIKNLDKIEMLEEDSYNRDGDWESRGSYDRGSATAVSGIPVAGTAGMAMLKMDIPEKDATPETGQKTV